MVSQAWSEERLIKRLQVTDWPLDMQRLQSLQQTRVQLPLRSGLKWIRSQSLGIGGSKQYGDTSALQGFRITLLSLLSI